MMTSEQELERSLRAARLVTTEALDRRILTDAATRLTHPNKSPQPLPPPEKQTSRRRRLRRLIPPVTVLGGLLLIAGWWFMRPSDSWALVVQAVREKTWIHLAGKSPDGKNVDLWLSTTQRISASREPSYMAFHDFRTGRSDHYSQESKEITRTESDAQSSDRRSFDTFSALFQELFRGEDSLSIAKDFADSPEIEKVEQSRKEVREGTGHWYDYHITFQQTGQGENGQEEKSSATMTIRVDAESMLPQTMTLVEGDSGPSPESVTLRFEFPDTGPQDIYALGVPKDARIVDLTPQPLDSQRKEIVDGIRTAAEGFDDYRALGILSQTDAPWHVGSPMLVWRKGNKMRMEIGCIDPDNPPPTETPDANADPEIWWKNRCRHLWFLPVQVYDGNDLYQCEYATPASDDKPTDHPWTRSPKEWVVTGWIKRSFPLTWLARTAPIVWVYPDGMEAMLTSPRYETDVATASTDDSPEAIRIKVVSTPKGQARRDEWEYHIDPQKGHALLESKTHSYSLVEGRKTLTSSTHFTFDQWKQSPKGFWYPARIQTDGMYLEDEKPTRNLNVTLYYLDFNLPLPDSLFEPRERPGRGFPD